MDSSSDEDIVKKKGWALVNKKGSIENSSDEEQVENVAVSKKTPDLPSCQDISTESEEVEPEGAGYDQTPRLEPLCFQLPPPESPVLQTPGSNSSSGSTLVSSLPSPLPHFRKEPPINKVKEDLSSVADILKSEVEKEDSLSVDSFEILSEPASGDCEPSQDSQSEQEDDEDAFAAVPLQNVSQRLTSDSESDFVRLKAPSEMDSAQSGIEEIPQGSSSQSSKSINSSPEPVMLPIAPRPVNAPYQDMRGISSEEELDHVRIMSRRWPTEDGGFLLVQRFKKLERDDISTVSSSISDFSSFSMMENSSRQRLISDTQEEEAGASDTESEVSYSSYASEEPLPVNMMVQNVPPAVRQYLHKRNDVFNSKLTIFTVLVLTAGLTLGIGHFVGSSQMVSHHETVQEGQKLRLRSLQDELVSCMDRRKEMARLYQEKEKEVHHCIEEKAELVDEISSHRDGDDSLTMTDSFGEDHQELRLCSGCRDAGLRYSKFCNTRCPADSMDGHSWVAMDVRPVSVQEYRLFGGSERQGTEDSEVTSSTFHVASGVNYGRPDQEDLSASSNKLWTTEAHAASLIKEVEEFLTGSSHLNEECVVSPLHSSSVNEDSEVLPEHSSSLNEEFDELPYEVIQEVPGHYLSFGEEGEEAVPGGHLVSQSKSDELFKVSLDREESTEGLSSDAVIDTSMESKVLLPMNVGDVVGEKDPLASDRSGNFLSIQEYEVNGDVNTPDRGAGNPEGLDSNDAEEGETAPRSVTDDLLGTNDFARDADVDSDEKWVCADDAEIENCDNWIPKAEFEIALDEHEKQIISDEIDDGTIDGDIQLLASDESECFSDDGQMEEMPAREEKVSENSKADITEKREGDAMTKGQGEVVEEMEGEALEEEEKWRLQKNNGWVPVDSEGENEGASLNSNNIDKSTSENSDVPEDHLDAISHALQSAWGIVENASRSITIQNVSLKDASDIVKEGVQGLKEVVQDAWDSVQTAASQVNEGHIRPVVKKVNRFVKKHWSGTGRTCKGKRCSVGRKNKHHKLDKISGKRARKIDLQHGGGQRGRPGRRNNKKIQKNLNVKSQPVTVKRRNVEEQKNQKGRNMKNKLSTRVQSEEDKVTSKKGNKGLKQVQINKHVLHSTGPAKPSETVLEKKDDHVHTMELQSEYPPPKTTREAVEKRNIPETGRLGGKSPPPVLNIEKVLDSMDMSCGGEVRCVENHKIDAARLLKEMISYRQWLWEQRFRKDVDEVEDFMEELEEFIDEEDVDDEDIEDLKDEFEDMVEDIQKTTKKFFRKQERQTRKKALDSGMQSVVEKTKGKQSIGVPVQKEAAKDEGKQQIKLEKQKKKQKKKKEKNINDDVEKDVGGNKPSSKGTMVSETVHTILFDPNELPSVQVQNSSQQTMSVSNNEDERKGEEGLTVEAGVTSPAREEVDKVFHEQKQVGGGYINTDEWFFRRAHDRQRRRRDNPDASWYFERFHSWEEERKKSGKNDWYFQWGRNREESRDCSTQPWHCEWAHDESVVTLWELYKWLTERFASRSDLRAWELEDQINWFLRKP